MLSLFCSGAQSLRLKWELDYVLSQVSPARVLVALLVTLAANPVTAPDRIPGRQVNLTAVWMSLRPDWRAEATRAQFATFTQTIIDVSDGMQGLTWVPILTDPSDREFLEKQAGRQLNLCPALTDAIASNNADVDTVQGKCPKGIRFSERSDKGLGLYQVGDKYAPVEPRGGPWQKGPAWRMCDSVMDAVNGTSPCSTTPYIALTMKNHAFYPVFYLHPGAGNSDAMLFDLSSSGARNGSISKAIIRNGFSTTSRLNLVQETGSQYGFISFIPVYHQLPCKPVAGQNVDFNKLCDTLVGLANAVFRITDLVKHSQESGTSMGDFGNGDATFSQWHDFLLDFGSVEDENDGWVGERIFLKGQDCKKLSTYNETYPNVDELHSSANESASAPNVVETLREILPQICEVVTARGDEFRLHKTGAIDQYKTSEYSFYGEAPGGMFTVFSFFVGDRRWAYIVWSADAAYRVPSQQRAGPIVVLITGIVLGLTAFAGLAYFLERRERARDLTEEIYQAQKTTMVLLANIFPPSYVPRVLRGDTSIAERYEDVTIIFSDIVGFTEFASHCPPKLVVQCLNIMYSIFDDITAKNDVFKVETIGDGYMISSGCPLVTKNNVARAADTAIDMLSAMPTIRELILGLELMENNKKAQEWAANCQIRIGMHTGPVVASVAGKKNPRFHLFGDTVNTASRMESNGTPGRIQMSEATRNYLAEDPGFVCHLRGTCQIKGKGLMNLYYLVGRAPELQEVQSSVSKPLDRTPGKGSREADSSVRPPLSSAEAAPSDVAIDINDAKKV